MVHFSLWWGRKGEWWVTSLWWGSKGAWGLTFYYDVVAKGACSHRAWWVTLQHVEVSMAS